jgi:hypothetical protein
MIPELGQFAEPVEPKEFFKRNYFQ